MQMRYGIQKFKTDLETRKEALSRALPASVDRQFVDRLIHTCIQAAASNTNIQRCNPASIMRSVYVAASLGVRVNTLGQAYLVPYGKECKLIIGYRGYIDLACRSKEVIAMWANVVREGDVFKDVQGSEPKLVHEPSPDYTANTKRIAAYACVKYANGHVQHTVVYRQRIEEIKKLYVKGRSEMWTKHPDEAWKKTAIRQLVKYIRLGLDEEVSPLQQAVNYEESVEYDNPCTTIEGLDAFDSEMVSELQKEHTQKAHAILDDLQVIDDREE